MKTPFLINRTFTILWAGQTVSSLGDFVFNTTLVLWIATHLAHNKTWAPLAVSGVLLANSIPTIFIGPLAGVFADRWDKRRAMLWADGLRVALILLLVPVTGLVPAALSGQGDRGLFLQLGAIYGIVIPVTVCAQLFTPARFAFIRDIVPPPDRPRASGLEQSTLNLAAVLGPALAGPLLVGFGIQSALIVNALSFVVSFLTTAVVPSPRPVEPDPPAERQGMLREFGAGVRVLVGSRILRGVFVSVALLSLGSGTLIALDVFFLMRNLHAPGQAFGVLIAALGAGAILGATVAGLVMRRIGVVRSYWLSMLTFGILVLFYARLTAVVPALIVKFLLGVPEGILNVALGPLLLAATPRAYTGRIRAILLPCVSVTATVATIGAAFVQSTLLRNFHATLLGLTIGPIDTTFSVAGASWW